MGILWSCCNDHPTSIANQSFATSSMRNNCSNEDKNVAAPEVASNNNLYDRASNNFNPIGSELLQRGCSSIVKILFCGNEDSNNNDDNANDKQQLPVLYINQIVTAEGDADALVEIAI